MYRLSWVICVALGVSSASAQDASTVYFFNPDWSPDGTKIVFESGVDGELSIYTIGLDGNNLTRLTNNENNDEGPVWSPDGEEIAFYSNRREGREERPVSLQIYVMNNDGTGQRRVTDEGSTLDYNISWAPDGNRLVFQSRPEINPGVHSLYTVGTDGMGRTRITDGQYNDFSPQWSPDGNRILFVRSVAAYKFFGDYTSADREQQGASAEIMVLNLEDGSILPITQNDVVDTDPSWNADGSETYYLQHDGQKKTLFQHHLGQTDAIAVADGDLVSHSRLPYRTRLSPNGRFLTYHKQVNGAFGI